MGQGVLLRCLLYSSVSSDRSTDACFWKISNKRNATTAQGFLGICFIHLRRSFPTSNLNFVWSCITNYFPYPPISHHGDKEHYFLFHQPFVFLQLVAMSSLRRLFQVMHHPTTPHIICISWQVTFLHSFIIFIAFPLEFLQTSILYLGCAAQNLLRGIAELLPKLWGAKVTPYSLQAIFCIVSSALAIKKSSSFQCEHFFCQIQNHSKLTGTFNIVNSIKLEEVILNWLSSLSLHPKMTEHFRITTRNT